MFSARMFTFLSVIMTVILFFSATFSIVTDIKKEEALRTEFEQLLSEVELFNESLNITDDGGDEDREEIEVTDPKELLLSAFGGLDNATSYYSEVGGKIYATVMDYTVDVDLSYRMALYPNGDFVQEIMGWSSSGFFKGENRALLIYYDAAENIIYRNYIANNASKINGKLVFNYDQNAWKKQPIEDYKKEFGIPEEKGVGTSNYVINEMTATKQVSYLELPTNDGMMYSIGYQLNSTLATERYVVFISRALEMLKEGFLKELSIAELNVYATVDSYGDMVSMIFDERFQFTISFGVTATASCTSDFTYMFANINEEISYPRPTFDKTKATDF